MPRPTPGWLVLPSAPLVLGCLLPLPAAARTLQVGPDAAYTRPSAAIAAAADGDTVEIAPGRYEDCAVVHQNRLVLEGSGPGVVLAGPVCQDKALLVVAGTTVTLRRLTLEGARAPDGNGAGVRAEGGDVLIADSRFLDNQNGILTGANPDATVTVEDSDFIGNGACLQACAHGIYAGRIGRLVVRRTRFLATRQGHAIKSRALVTEVEDSDIRDGPTGTGSYLVDVPQGGDILIARNRMEKGPHSGNPLTAIMIGEEGPELPTPSIVVRDNCFANRQSRRTTFVRNFTATPARLSGNRSIGPVRPLAQGWLDVAMYRAGRGLRRLELLGRHALGLR